MSYISNHTKTEKLLLEAARIFNSTIEYEDLICQILKLVMTAVNCEAAAVFRVDHDRTDMRGRNHDIRCDIRFLNPFNLLRGRSMMLVND